MLDDISPTIRRLSKSQRLILDVLERNDWACGADFLSAGAGWAFSTRMSELRQLGFSIRKRRCRRHSHQATVYEYSISVEPSESLDG